MVYSPKFGGSGCEGGALGRPGEDVTGDIEETRGRCEVGDSCGRTRGAVEDDDAVVVGWSEEV